MYLECAADKAWFPRPAESHAGREIPIKPGSRMFSNRILRSGNLIQREAGTEMFLAVKPKTMQSFVTCQHGHGT